MTLVEVILAVFILTVLFSGVLSSLARANSAVQLSTSVYRGTAILNEKMEEMRSMTFAQLQTNLAKAAFLSGTIQNADSGTPLAGARTFTWTRAVDTGASTSSLVRVVVTLSWKEGVQPQSIQTIGYFSSTGVSTVSSL